MESLNTLQQKLHELDNPTHAEAVPEQAECSKQFFFGGLLFLGGLVFSFSIATLAGTALIIWGAYIWRERRIVLPSQDLLRNQMTAEKLWVEIKRRILTAQDAVTSFDPKPDFPTGAYQSSPLFPHAQVNVFRAKDQLSGTFNTVPYILVDLETLNRVKNEDGSGFTTQLIFRGVLFSADFNKRFSSTTFVTTDTSEKKLGALARRLQRLDTRGTNFELVELETPAFEQHFVVRSTDPVEARYILSLNFMDQILALKRSLNADIQLCFIQGKMMMSIPSMTHFLDNRRDMACPDIQKKAVESDLHKLLGIIDHLQIDERIWTQQKASGAN